MKIADNPFWIFLSVVSLTVLTLGEDLGDEEDDAREGKYMSETWHAVQTIPEGATGWIPRDPPVLIKRRRLRKRKRRPPVNSYLDQISQNVQTVKTNYSEETPNETATTKYDYSIKSSNSWEDLTQEQSLKPYPSRKRVTPPDWEAEDLIIKTGPIGASIRFGSEPTYHNHIKKEDRVDTDDLFQGTATAATTTTKRPNLKEILKQSGGISLSEVLQQKNITLAELLMGKNEAIKALTESTLKPTDTSTTTYRRVPPSAVLKKDAPQRKATYDEITSKEMAQAQRKRFTLLQGRKPALDGKTRYEVTMETTTQKLALQEEYQSSTSRPPTSTQKVNKKLPITNAKILKLATKKPPTTTIKPIIVIEEDNYPPLKPIKIDVKEVVGYPLEEEKTSNGPLHMTIDLEEESPTTTKATTTDIYPRDLATTTEDSTTNYQPSTSAKDEILQLLKDPRGRAGLARILEARNMTIQELIELRERGSSQRHLADIFHNNTKEPEPLEEPLEGKIAPEEFPNVPVFSRHPKELRIDDNATTNLPQEVNIPRYKIESSMSEEVKHAEEFPWQKLYPELFSGHNKPSGKERVNDNLVKQPVDVLTEEDLRILDEIDQTLYASASNEDVNVVEETNIGKVINISSGVKSAIVASLAIIFLSMLVFVTILLAFRWTQRKKKISYNDNLLQIKCGHIKSFVSETLGRKKAHEYKRHLQSMSDDSWERGSRRKSVY